ncbi:peptidylprolyl isomerase [Leptolyngbya sp. FACHB-261]|uniref:peptidylprolyl isomerase n=1 Tax=Leptolyngbya sp. FACHB-261 TaxID=2692806 RepID=UPI001682D287|nr:peptidylprolyl isomerase [Leptolyngbya sp. FACHB-261]MBD2105127.1 peptidylprolyl isomerase [Leptolyngbya sp. FACHB-261]
MTTVLQVDNRAITAEEIIPLLAGYQMLPQLLREIIIDQAVAAIQCTPEESDRACQQFYEHKQLNSEAARSAWQVQAGLSTEQVAAMTTRNLRLEKFKQATWGNKLEPYFLQRKTQLDKVIYSLIRTQDPGTAQELYFRIREGEQSFGDLAREHSQGPEAQTGGLIGPAELSTPNPALARMLCVSQPGQLWPPTRLGEWLVIVRLEKFVPARLDPAMKQRLLNELFESWLQAELDRLNSVHL